MDDCVCYVTLRSGGTWFPVVRVGGGYRVTRVAGKTNNGSRENREINK